MSERNNMLTMEWQRFAELLDQEAEKILCNVNLYLTLVNFLDMLPKQKIKIPERLKHLEARFKDNPEILKLAYDILDIKTERGYIFHNLRLKGWSQRLLV